MKAIVQQGWQRVCDVKALQTSAGHFRAATRFLQRGVADLVFPPRCVSCESEFGEDSAVGEASICSECLEQFTIFEEPMCALCGAPLPFAPPPDDVAASETATQGRNSAVGCYRCRGRKMWFDATIALGLYGGLLKNILLRMKQSEGDALSLAMGRLVWQTRGERLSALGADVVAPIPLHWRRRVAHRTNSASLLAEILSTKMGVPGADKLLRRNRSTQRQFDLSPPKRWENVRKAFAVRRGYHLRDAHVVLVDDILTTGATCSEAARALRDAGALRVTVVVAARALG